MKLASHLGLSLQRVKQETTSSEFALWRKYFEEEPNHFHREDYYMAQIAAWIVRANSKFPERIKDDDFILPFAVKEAEKEVEVDEDELIERKTRRAKSFFFALTGYTEEQG